MESRGMLEIKPRALHMLGKCCTSELCPLPSSLIYEKILKQPFDFFHQYDTMSVLNPLSAQQRSDISSKIISSYFCMCFLLYIRR